MSKSQARLWPKVIPKIAFVVIALIAAGAFGFAALLLGSDFAASPPAQPGTSVFLWSLAGAALAAPVALMPALSFQVARRNALLVAVVIVVRQRLDRGTR